MPFAGLASKVVLVTGAARRRGIGRATALRFAREGCDVACLDIARPYDDFPEYWLGSADELEELVGEIRTLGCRALSLRADVSSWDELHRAVAEAHETLGRIDVCCNVAGGSGFGMGSAPLLQLSEREWDRVVDVNLKGTWIVARACAERMIDSGRGGRIVNVSSQAGKRGFPTMGAYCAAKAGVLLLTQVLAIELAPFGITVNAVCPGTVDTDLLQKNLAFEHIAAGMGAEFQQWIAREIPLGRLETADEVASAIAFLASDEAAYITGEALNVSGGQTMV